MHLYFFIYFIFFIFVKKKLIIKNITVLLVYLKFTKYVHIRRLTMQDVKTYLSTAPVLATLWFGLLAGLLIEINRFFPDALILPFF